jgi:hypothetical protein
MSDGGIKVEQFQIPKSDPLTFATDNREEMEAVAAGLIALVKENSDGVSHFGGAVNRILGDEMTVEAIMIKGLLAQKSGRVPWPVLSDSVLGNVPATNVLPFTGRRKRNPRSE